MELIQLLSGEGLDDRTVRSSRITFTLKGRQMNTYATEGLSIRTIRADEIDKVIQWTSEEGWNLGLNDGKAFMVADPTGLLVACLDGEPVAAISVVKYGEDFAFLGLYIARKDLRGKGFGYPLWQAGMTSLEGRTVGLDAVVAQQENYARSGFVLEHRNTRYCGSPQLIASNDPHVQSLGPELLEQIIDYDKSFFPANREAFLTYWLATHTSHSVAYIEDGIVKGYGAIRPAESGFKIGPLFADSEREADAIFCSLSSWAEGAAIILDIPEPNHTGTAIAQRHGLLPLFETARMYRGQAPHLPLTKIYGMSTLEIG